MIDVPVGYKQTDVGVIPEDWEVKTIKEIANVKGGKRLPAGKSLIDTITPHPYIRVTDMIIGGVCLDDIKYVPEDAFPIIRNYRIFIDDIFISVAGTLGVVGKIPLELNGANLTENADKITNISCNQDFLFYNLTSERIQSIIDAEKTVGAQPKLALGRIEGFHIPLPPTINEQTAIATALSDVDALLNQLDKLIAKKRDIKQATMQQLLTGKKRLAGFSGEWEVKKLGEVAELITKGTTPTSIGKNFTSSGIKFIKIESIGLNGNIFEDKIAFIDKETDKKLNRSQLKEGDLLISIAGALGRVAIVNKSILPANTNQALAIVRFTHNSQLNPTYTFYFLFLDKVKKHIEGISVQGAQANLSLQNIKDFAIDTPPTLEEQTAIATLLTDMDTEITQLQQRRHKTHALKQGMMQQLLTGKIRLI